MITAENLSEILNSLTAEEITKAMDSKKDYLLFEVHIFIKAFTQPQPPQL